MSDDIYRVTKLDGFDLWRVEKWTKRHGGLFWSKVYYEWVAVLIPYGYDNWERVEFKTEKGACDWIDAHLKADAEREARRQEKWSARSCA